MLMMIDYNIGTSINKKMINLFHSGTRQMVMFMSSMHYHDYLLCILSCCFNFIVLPNRIQRIRTTRMRCCYRKFMLATVYKSNSYTLDISIQCLGSLFDIHSSPNNI